jgi:O-antigen ligase
MAKKKKNKIKPTPKTPFFYKLGIILILLLPLLSAPPLFTPPAFGKSIPFKIILSALLIFFIYDIFFSKKTAVVERFIAKKRKKKEFSFYAPLILIFTLFIGVIFSVDPNFSIFGGPSRGGGFLNFLFLTFFIYFLYFLLNKKDWSTVWKTLFFTGAFSGVVAFMQWKGFAMKEVSRAFAAFGNPTILGVFLAVLIFPLLLFILKESSKTKKWVYFLILLLTLLGTMLSFTRSAFLGLAVGMIYFVFFYPKKEKATKYLKVGFASLVVVTLFGVYYINTSPLPSFVDENPLLSKLTKRLDVENALKDPRIGGFMIGWEALKERPITGYGMENFAYAFDKHYYPEAPFISRDIPWWDKAHNLPIEMGIGGGFPAMIALLLVFLSLILTLQKKKEVQELEAHTMQATLITFFVANFFTVDDFTTYLLMSIVIAYSFYLCFKERKIDLKKEIEKRSLFYKYQNVFLVVVIPVFLLFTHLNFSMLIANKNIIKAREYVQVEDCERAREIASQATKKDSPISFYLLFNEAIIIEKCSQGVEDQKEIYSILQKVIKERPFYLRAYTSLGSTATKIINESEEKDELMSEAIASYHKVSEISPYRYFSYKNLSLLYLYSGDFEKAKENAEKCLTLKKDEEECLFTQGVSLFALEEETASLALKECNEKGYDTVKRLESMLNYHIKDDQSETIILFYLLLIEENPDNSQYYSSLAAAYKNIKDYEKAKEYALKALEVEPRAVNSVNDFLNSLPN